MKGFAQFVFVLFAMVVLAGFGACSGGGHPDTTPPQNNNTNIPGDNNDNGNNTDNTAGNDNNENNTDNTAGNTNGSESGGADETFDPTPKNITDGILDSSYNPAWISDNEVVFTGKTSSGSLGLFRIKIDGTSFKTLSNDTDHDFVNLPGSSFCQQNDELVLSSDRGGHDDIWILGLDDGIWTVVTDTADRDYEPSWSPNCEWIVFQSLKNSNWDIYKVKSDGSSLTRLTRDPSNDWEPNWSPDGKWIVFQSDRDGQWRLYLVHPDGSGLIALTPSGSESTDASWTPDSSKIVYSGDSRETNSEDISVIDINTKEITNLTNHVGYEGAPSWSPDGRFILFEADWSGRSDIWMQQVAN